MLHSGPTSSPRSSLRVAQVVPDTAAEGPGRRFAVWVQGCPLACPGCFNPETHDPAPRQTVPVPALAREVDLQENAAKDRRRNKTGIWVAGVEMRGTSSGPQAVAFWGLAALDPSHPHLRDAVLNSAAILSR